MGCPICRNLQLDYESRVCEYIEARSSASYEMSKKLAAQKNVEMERARYELEEHQFVCVKAVRVTSRLPMREVSTHLGRLVA